MKLWWWRGVATEVVLTRCGGVDDEGGVAVVLRVGGDGRGGVATVAAQVVRRLWVGRDGGDWVGVGCEQVVGRSWVAGSGRIRWAALDILEMEEKCVYMFRVK
ncbi:hypothetical protein Tco_0781403 [Tanacetum coccineum]